MVVILFDIPTQWNLKFTICFGFQYFSKFSVHAILYLQTLVSRESTKWHLGPDSSGSEKAMAPHSILLPGKSHGLRSLVGCSPGGHEESDTTEWLHFHFSLSRIGEGNGNPLQCSCLENPRDDGAWWAAVSGVAQSRTRLKRLSSSSSKK